MEPMTLKETCEQIEKHAEALGGRRGYVIKIEPPLIRSHMDLFTKEPKVTVVSEEALPLLREALQNKEGEE